MARKVTNIANSSDSNYMTLSQTPKNYNTKNFFIKELQDKVNAEWPYRANRVDVEVETILGSQQWDPLEVIVQSVKSDKTSVISNDFRRLVFKNIREDRFNVGHKFRFAPNYDPEAILEHKDTWLVTNFNQIKLTNTVIIQRCNGTLGSTYVDENGVTHLHYEPVIQGADLSSVNFFYNETMVAQQSQLFIIAQHNEFTRRYFVNQRFIIGYDKIYRLKAINKFYANSTNNAENVGLVRMYLEVTEDTNKYDNFETRIAYQGEIPAYVQENQNSNYSIKFTSPLKIPTYLSEEGVTFTPVVYNGEAEQSGVSFTVNYTLQNLPEGIDMDKYILFNKEDNNYIFKRIRKYINGNLVIEWTATPVEGETLTAVIELSVLDL